MYNCLRSRDAECHWIAKASRGSNNADPRRPKKTHTGNWIDLQVACNNRMQMYCSVEALGHLLRGICHAYGPTMPWEIWVQHKISFRCSRGTFEPYVRPRKKKPPDPTRNMPRAQFCRAALTHRRHWCQFNAAFFFSAVPSFLSAWRPVPTRDAHALGRDLSVNLPRIRKDRSSSLAAILADLRLTRVMTSSRQRRLMRLDTTTVAWRMYTSMRRTCLREGELDGFKLYFWCPKIISQIFPSFSHQHTYSTTN